MITFIGCHVILIYFDFPKTFINTKFEDKIIKRTLVTVFQNNCVVILSDE